MISEKLRPILRIWSSAFTKKAAPTIEDFFTQELRLTADDRYRNFLLDLSPWVRMVWVWWSDSFVEWIYLMQGSQTSKTLTMMGLLLYAAKYDPGPAMWTQATEDEAKDFVTQRLKVFLSESAKEGISKHKVNWKNAVFRIYGQRVKVAYATSGPVLRGWPCRYIFADETGIWPESLKGIGNPIEYVKKRTRTFDRPPRLRKGIFGTTPSVNELHPANVAALGADVYQWWVPCKECGAYQFLSFKNLVFDQCKTNGEWDLDRVESETVYRCPECGEDHTEADKHEMISHGKPMCVSVERTPGEFIPNYNPKEPTPGQRDRTLHMPSTYSVFTSWGKLARMFLKAKSEGVSSLQVFITDELAEIWHDEYSANRKPLDVVYKLRDARPRGLVPSETQFLVAFVDVQRHVLYYVVRAVGFSGQTWLVREGVLPRVDGRLDHIEELFKMDWRDRTGLYYEIAATGIDSGGEGEEFATLVYSFCFEHPLLRCFPTKGSSHPIPSWTRETAIEKIEGGLKLLLIDTDKSKCELMNRLQVAPGDPGAWAVHKDIEDDYAKQVLNEVRGEDGRWKRLGPNHYLDCESNIIAICHHYRWLHLRPPEPEQPGQKKSSEDDEKEILKYLTGGRHV